MVLRRKKMLHIKPAEPKQKQKMGFMDKTLIIMGVSLVIFISAMCIIYLKTGGVPDSLVDGFFSIFTFEGGFMAFIKATNTFKEAVKEIKSTKISEDDQHILDE